MRTLGSLLFLTALASPVAAAPARFAPIDASTVPEACRARIPATTLPLAGAISARMALGQCIAEANLAPLHPVDSQDSVDEMRAAILPAIGMFDDVVANGDPISVIIAERARRDLYVSVTQRLVNSIPQAPGESGVALHQLREQQLETLLVPFRNAAALSARHIVAIAENNPKLATNPVVTVAVRSSRDLLRAQAEVVAAAAPVPPPPEAPAEEPAAAPAPAPAPAPTSANE